MRQSPYIDKPPSPHPSPHEAPLVMVMKAMKAKKVKKDVKTFGIITERLDDWTCQVNALTTSGQWLLDVCTRRLFKKAKELTVFEITIKLYPKNKYLDDGAEPHGKLKSLKKIGMIDEWKEIFKATEE